MCYANREEFATQIIKSLQLKTGMEVGVREGFFARHLLSTTDITLHGVDLWLMPSAIRLVREFPGRYFLKQGVSPAIASAYENEAFDFIHIDACHSYAAVVADLSAWWPKLMSGGIFSGDDYAFTDNPTEGVYGVVEAVNEFVTEHSLKLFVSGVPSNNREDQLAYARFHGENAGKYLRGLPHEKFLNPAWWVQKAC